MDVVVKWDSLDGLEVEVDGAEDRWDAVVKAAGMCGLDKQLPMQVLFDTASVKKRLKKKERVWRVED